MRAKILGIKVSELGTVALTLQPERSEASDKCIGLLQKFLGKFLSFDVKDPTKRSLTANAYMWKLCDELGRATGNTKDDVYRLMIRRAGVFEDVYVKREGLERWINNWCVHGTGWICDIVDDLGELITVRTYYGSSSYNRAEMARLIDCVVDECRNVGIETRSREEIDSLLRTVSEN